MRRWSCAYLQTTSFSFSLLQDTKLTSVFFQKRLLDACCAHSNGIFEAVFAFKRNLLASFIPGYLLRKWKLELVGLSKVGLFENVAKLCFEFVFFFAVVCLILLFFSKIDNSVFMVRLDMQKETLAVFLTFVFTIW